MKKLFHRRKHNELDSSLSQSSPYSPQSDAGVRTSRYDTTSVGGVPQTGEYPIKGNDTPNVLKKKPSRRSSIRSWRSSSGSQQPAIFNRSPTPDHYASRNMPPSSSNSNTLGSEPYAPQPAAQKRWSRTELPQEFSNINLANDGQSNDLPFLTSLVLTLNSPILDHNDYHHHQWTSHHHTYFACQAWWT